MTMMTPQCHYHMVYVCVHTFQLYLGTSHPKIRILGFFSYLRTNYFIYSIKLKCFYYFSVDNYDLQLMKYETSQHKRINI